MHVPPSGADYGRARARFMALPQLSIAVCPSSHGGHLPVARFDASTRYSRALGAKTMSSSFIACSLRARNATVLVRERPSTILFRASTRGTAGVDSRKPIQRPVSSGDEKGDRRRPTAVCSARFSRDSREKGAGMRTAFPSPRRRRRRCSPSPMDGRLHYSHRPVLGFRTSRGFVSLPTPAFAITMPGTSRFGSGRR